MTVPSAPRQVRFGDFVADFDSFELRKHGIRLRLQDQPFQILRLLLQHPGLLVTRDQLRMELWTESTFVDFDAGLNAAVRRLRDALNDSAEDPRYIETLPRHGYRFIAPVEITAQPPLTPHSEVPLTSDSGHGPQQVAVPPEQVRVLASKQVKTWRMTWTRSLAIACVLVVVVGIAAVALRSRASANRSGNGRVYSVAVLPLQNLSGDPSQDYFADGMTDALITNLAQSKSLHVTSSTSSMRYKGTHKTLPEIGRELNVNLIVEGSVIRSGNQVRVTAQLLDAAKDRHLWARRYDRDLRDVLQLQSELASAVALEVAGRISPDERLHLAVAKPVNPEAYEASLKGRYYWNKRSLEGLNKGLALFQQAIQADPTYAPAYAGMADCYNFLGLGMGSMPPREYAQKAKEAAQKALELDENFAKAHAARGFTLYRYDWNWPEAEQEYRRALELDPQDIIVRGWFADLLSFLGRRQEAEAQREQVRDLDPFSIQAVRSVAGAYGAANQYDKAIDYYKKAIASEPDSFRMRMDLGGDYLQAKRYQDATEEFQQVLTLYGPNVYPLARLGYSYALWGKTAEAERILGQLKKEHRPGYVSYAIAEICEALGRKEEALGWLEKAHGERAAQMIGLKWGFDSLRSDSRFQDLVRHVGVPNW